MCVQTMVTMVGTYALIGLFNMDIIKDSALWTEVALTPAGKALVQNTSLPPCSETLPVQLWTAPFRTPDRSCSHSVPSIQV